MFKGIDISENQNPSAMNFDSIAKEVDFVIIRAGITTKEGVPRQDIHFETFYKELSKRGVPLGAYYYSRANTTDQANVEAEFFLNLVKDKSFSYPFYIDVEDVLMKINGKTATTDAVINFCKTVEKAGYYAGFYTNPNWMENKLIQSSLKPYDRWIARWGGASPGYDAGIWQYSSTGRLAGYSGDLDMNYAYKDYPTIIQNMKGNSMQKVITEAKKWLGTKQGDSNHKAIIDGYNSIKPLPLGYKVTYTDSWCDAFVSFVFKQAGALALIGGGECGVERHIQLFKNLGIWIEDGTVTPKVGDIITYNWDKATQPNDGFADHIGIVEKVSGSSITVIEGNIDAKVGRRTIQVGNGYIRGYARPKYSTSSSTSPTPTPVKKSNTEIADEVIAGKWGTGTDRKTKLQAAGCDYNAIQKIVNDKMAKPSKKSSEEIAKEVLAGKWGNGIDRKNKLQAAGYDYNAVQKIVNSKAPATKPTHTSKSGTWKFNTAVKIRSTPSTSSGDTGLIYTSGMTVNIASTQVADGYIWGKYTSTSGQTRYVALQKVNGIAYGKWV